MKMARTILVTALGIGALSVPTAHAASIRLTFDYMATNLKGDFATASGGTAVPVAHLTLTDIGDLGIANPSGGISGVRAAFSLEPTGLSQFSNGTGSVFISAYLLNFPGTSECGNATCSTTGTINGYDTDANLGAGNQWTPVSGTSISSIEWAENGANNGWGSGTTDPAFGQELNWGNGGALNQTTGVSVIDLFSTDGRDDISVASLLANPVLNSVDGSLPPAYGWIKIRSNASADPAARGIDSTDTWYGTPQTSGSGANQRWQLNVLATGYQTLAVPEPSEYLMMASGLAMLAMVRRGKKKHAA